MNLPVIVSFPKSGRTWLRFMLTTLGFGHELTHAGADHRKKLTFQQLRGFVDELTSRRIIFMHRDPRDTVVSGYFQVSNRLRIFDGSISQFIRDQRFGIEKNVLYNLMWLTKASSFPAFVKVSYEDLQWDASSHLARIVADLGGREPGEDAIRNAVVLGHFDNMRALEASGAGAKRFGKALAPTDPDDPDSYKTRKGAVGGYREVLSPTDIQFCDRILDEYNYTAHVRD